MINSSFYSSAVNQLLFSIRQLYLSPVDCTHNLSSDHTTKTMIVKHRNMASCVHLLIILFYSSLHHAVESLTIQANHQSQLGGGGSSSSKTKQQSGINLTSTTTGSNQQQPQQEKVSSTKHLEPTLNDISLDTSEPRSASFESSATHASSVSDHDETVPLATINNHSRNNQPQARPPQYVDVSNLVTVSIYHTTSV